MTDIKDRVCLSIAGLDPSGGAGIIADIKTFAAYGCYAAAAVTSVTYQNTTGVFGAVHQTADSVHRQIDAVINDLDVFAVKTGMLPTREIVETVAVIISEGGLKNIVVDPVIRSTSGFDLIDKDAVQALLTHLFPLATLVTPNIPEAEFITGIAIESEEDMRDAATMIHSMGAANVLIKGGHLSNAESATRNGKLEAVDRLFADGDIFRFTAGYIDTTATHGTGCVLSSAIAANLANGKSLHDAVQAAKDLVTNAILTAPKIGHGNSPVNV